MLWLDKGKALARIVRGFGMNLGRAGIELITKWELRIPYLYDDGGQKGLGNATVAIGILVHLGPYHEQRGVCADCDEWPRKREGNWLTTAQMDALLLDKANGTGRFAGGQNYVGAVNAAFPSGINQNRFDAMCSYSYNYGSGAVGRMAQVFYAGGNMERAFTNPLYLKPDWAAAGLLRRRKDEYALWSSNAAPGLPPVEDEMWKRHNEAAVTPYWKPSGHTFAAGERATLNLGFDLPNVMKLNPKAVDIDWHARSGGGRFDVFDGDGKFAGRLTADQKGGVIRVVPKDGTIIVAAADGPVTVALGVVGYLD